MSKNLWNTPGMPHRGWTNMGMEDLGEASHKCEMCGQEEIRYVHKMFHPEKGRFDVGSVCAGVMIEGYVGTEEKKEFKSHIGKRQRWEQKQWKVVKKKDTIKITKGTQTYQAEAEKLKNVKLWKCRVTKPVECTYGFANSAREAADKLDNIMKKEYMK